MTIHLYQMVKSSFVVRLAVRLGLAIDYGEWEPRFDHRGELYLWVKRGAA